MMGTTTAPTTKVRRSHRGVATISVLTALALAALGAGIGWRLARAQPDPSSEMASSAVPEEELHSDSVTPSDDWQRGAAPTWSTSVTGPKMELTYSTNHVFALTDETNLTAYSYSEDSIGQSWSATLKPEDVRLSSTTTDIQQWGDAWVAVGSTLYDLSTGESLDAPWGAGARSVVVGDVAISCDANDLCTGWGTDLQSRWTITAPGTRETKTPPSNASPIYFARNYVVRQGHRYAPLKSTIVDIDTGETTTLNSPSDTSDVTVSWAIKDGWSLYYHKESTDQTWVADYDLSGNQIDTYERTVGLAIQDPRIYPARNLPATDEWRNKNSDLTQDQFSRGVVTRVDGATCLSSITVTNGASFSAPQPFTKKEGDPLTCFTVANSSDSGTIITLTSAETGFQSFGRMYNGNTGEDIDFEGMSATDSSRIRLVTPTYAIGYNPATGQLTGYRAAG